MTTSDHDGCVAQLLQMGFDETFNIEDLSQACNQANNNIIETINILTHRRDRPSQNQFDEQKQEEYIQEEKTKPFKSVQRGLIKCVGDCGSEFAKMVEDSVNHQSIEYLMHQYQYIIQDAFQYNDNPLRKSLIQLIKKKRYRIKYKDYYNDLERKDYVVCDGNSVYKLLQFFKEMIFNYDKDILQEIANQTCYVPVRTLIDEIRQGKGTQLNELQNKYDALQTVLSMHREDTKDDMDNNWITNKTKALKIQIEKEKKRKIETKSNMMTYLKKLEFIKQHRNYKRMKRQNCCLSDLEILAVLFYCDEDFYCYELRRSHREKQLNSCKWKNLYFYLCRAIDKMYHVFHHQNEKWLKKRSKFELFHGTTICYLDDQSKRCLKQTVISFTTSWSVAKGFADKIKMDPKDKKGMILVIHNGIKSLYDGDLRGADVSWLSKHGAEDEFLILPTTFRDFGVLNERQRLKKGWIITEQDHNMYITSNVKSTDVTFTTTDIDNQNDGISSWFASNSSYYELTMEAIDCTTELLKFTVGHFKRWRCPKCKVTSRFLELTGKITDLNIECPSCRSFVFRSHSVDNEYDREFSCHNPNCEPIYGKIRRSNLISVGQLNDGLKCTKCKEKQKTAYLNAVVNDEDTLNSKVEHLLHCVERCTMLHYCNTIGKMDNPEFTEEECKLNKQKYRADLKKIVKYMYSKQNEHASLSDILREFPIIWKWISSVNVVKLVLDAYKDGYTDFLCAGLIDKCNNLQINKDNARIMGSMVGKKIQNIDFEDINAETYNQFLDGIQQENDIPEMEKDIADNIDRVSENVSEQFNLNIDSQAVLKTANLIFGGFHQQ